MKQRDFYKDLGFISNACLNFTPCQAYRAVTDYGAVMIDIRAEGFSDYKCPDVKDIVFIPFEQVEQRYKELSKDTLFIVFDSSGIHSGEVVKYLMQQGYVSVANLAGGVVEWERDGMPMIIDKRERLSGSCMCQLRHRENK